VARLWVNRPAAIIGRSQAMGAEIDLACARAEGVAALRRISGGGAVLHYPGNLNVSVSVSTEPAEESVRAVVARWIGAVRDGLRILSPCVASSGNRLLVGDRKLGGAAQARRRGGTLFHTTVLVEPCSWPMDRFLRAHRAGYRTDRVASRPESTLCLSEALGRAVKMAEVCEAVCRGLAVQAPLDPDRMHNREAGRARILAETKYRRDEWNLSR
jgi:lipoate-protein ligase A